MANSFAKETSDHNNVIRGTLKMIYPIMINIVSYQSKMECINLIKK